MDHVIAIFVIFAIVICGYLKRILDRVNDLEHRTPTILTLPIQVKNVPELKEHMDWTKQKIQDLESKYGTLNSRIIKIRRLIK